MVRSIGESQELEHSASSTNPHTVSLYADAQEFPAPIIQIAPTRRGIIGNSVISNSDYYVETSDNTSVTASNSNRNDVIT